MRTYPPPPVALLGVLLAAGACGHGRDAAPAVSATATTTTATATAGPAGHEPRTPEEQRAGGLTVLSVENCLDGQGSDETVRYGDRTEAIRVARVGAHRYRVYLLRLVGADAIDPSDYVTFDQRTDRPPGGDGFYFAKPVDAKTRDAMRRGGCGPRD